MFFPESATTVLVPAQVALNHRLFPGRRHWQELQRLHAEQKRLADERAAEQQRHTEERAAEQLRRAAEQQRLVADFQTTVDLQLTNSRRALPLPVFKSWSTVWYNFGTKSHSSSSSTSESLALASCTPATGAGRARA